MKRLLSMILALAMIMALIPAVAADGETETATEKTYKFTGWATKGALWGGDAKDITAFSDTDRSWGWSYLTINEEARKVAEEKGSSYSVTEDEVTTTTNVNNIRVRMVHDSLRLMTSRSATSGKEGGYSLEKGIQIALKLEAPQKGFYRASTKGKGYGSDDAAQLYLSKYDDEDEQITKYTDASAAFFENTVYGYTGYQSNSSADTAFDAKTANDLNGLVYSDGSDLVFGVDTGEKTKYIYSLTLTPVIPALSYTVESDVIGINATTNSYVTATWTEDEGEQSQKVVNSFVIYKSSDEEIATVSATGEITGVAKGTATITATVGGVAYTKEITVANLSGVTVEYSFDKANYTSLSSPDEISYENSKGTLAFGEVITSYGTKYDFLNKADGTNKLIRFSLKAWDDNNKHYAMMKIRVPDVGQYKITLEHGKYASSGAQAVNMYIFDGDVKDIPTEIDKEESVPVLKDINMWVEAGTSSESSVASGGIFEASEPGEYLLVFTRTSTAGGQCVVPKKLILDGGNSETPLIYADISLNETTLEVGGTATLTQGTAYLSNGTETDAVGITYKSTNEAVATVSGTTVTAIGAGTAKIQAVRADGYVLDEETITVENKELKDAFAHESTTENAVAVPTAGVTVNTYVYTVDGTKKELDETNTIPAGAAYEVDADKITGMDGYEFLYWAKGATMDKKQIVSGNAKYSFIPTVEATHLIAVFAPTNAEETAKAEFYNGNGQLLPAYTVTSSETITIPELPSMAGYGDATHWELYGDTTATEYKKGDSVPLSGSMIFVAQYKELEADIKINVTDGSCDKPEYKYGDVVICTPTDEENFKFWKKDGVIVSMDKEYKFNAWENCTVEAVTGQYYFAGKATKLLIDIINDKFIMAEFIGLSNYGNVVEKGIMIGNNRFAMQKPLATQFTLEADNAEEAATAVAYAIFDDGTMITDK